MKITDINSVDVNQIWPLVEDQIQLAIDRSQGEYSLSDVQLYLLTGDMRLWIAYEGKDIIASAVTQLVKHSNGITCVVLYMAGTMMEQWKAYSAAVEEWAKENGAVKMQAFVRKGITRAFKDFDYHHVYDVVQKDLTVRSLH